MQDPEPGADPNDAPAAAPTTAPETAADTGPDAVSGTVVGSYPHQPVPFTKVEIDGPFWRTRLDTNRTKTIPSDFQKCEDTGRLANFAVAAGRQPGKHVGIYYNDSDVFKVIEGASYSLATHPGPELDAYIRKIKQISDSNNRRNSFKAFAPTPFKWAITRNN